MMHSDMSAFISFRVNIRVVLTVEGYQAGGIYVADPDKTDIRSQESCGQVRAESFRSCV